MDFLDDVKEFFFYFGNLKDFFEFLSYIATIISVIAIVYVIKDFKKSVDDSKKVEESKLMENSIEVLRIFSENIIPNIDLFNTESKTMYINLKENIRDKVREEEGNEVDKIPDELDSLLVIQAKLSANGGRIFNQLEQACAYVSYELIIHDVVYPSVHSVFLGFVNDNKDLLDSLTTFDVPFKNVHMVYKKWNKESQRESLLRKREDIEEELNSIK